jgi:hypothetical protein
MKKHSTRAEPVRPFGEYQRIVEQTDVRKRQLASLPGLVGEVGDLHVATKDRALTRYDDPVDRYHFNTQL